MANGSDGSAGARGTADPLTRELLAWISSRPRTYAEAMEAWRSNCPRHSIWDDALSAGLARVRGKDVTLTPLGLAALDGDR